MTTLTEQGAPTEQRRSLHPLIVILFSLFAWAPLLYPGFIQTHTGLGPIYDALAVRSPLSGWLPAYGSAGDGPLATWLLAILQAALGPLAALKLLYALTFILAGLGMYLLSRRAWGVWPSIVAAAVYMLIPYRLVVVYVRGALAEALVLALAPFLLVVLSAATHSSRRRNLLGVVLLTLVLGLTNFGLGLLLAIVALVWNVTLAQQPDTRYPAPDTRSSVLSLSSLVVGLVLGLLALMRAGSSFLVDMPDWREHFVYFFQLLSPTWGFGESVAGWQDSISFQVGLAPIALAILALWGAYESKDDGQRRTVLILSALACVLLFLTLTIAAPLWRLVPLSALVAYPWQLLGLAALPLAMLAAAATHTLMPADKPPSLAAVAVLLSAIVLGSYTYLAPRFVDAADLPDVNHPPLAQLGGEILLLDTHCDSEAQAGGVVRLSLTWQALRQPAADYTIFVHLVDAQGVQRGQMDVRPHNGEKPTDAWLRGEVVRDDISVPVNPDAPPGEYHLNVGMYLLATMQRLPVAGSGQDHVILAPIAVR